MSHEDKIDFINRELDKPLVLIGLMGVGKSRIGRELGKALGMDFMDSDNEIEKAAGMGIPDIFERHGEKSFRDGEHRVVRRLIEGGVQVIATGGGAVMTGETALLVWDKSVSIWLRADLDVMVERTSRKKNRPLLNAGNPEEILAGLMEKRYPVYGKADIVIDSHGGQVRDIIAKIIDELCSYIVEHTEE